MSSPKASANFFSTSHPLAQVSGAMAMATLARVALRAPAVRRVPATSSPAVVCVPRVLGRHTRLRSHAACSKTSRCAAAPSPASHRDLPVVSASVHTEFGFGFGFDVPHTVAKREGDTRSPAVAFASLSMAVVANAAYATASIAMEGYQGIGVPDDEATPLQNAFGFVFTVFCGWYFLRVVKKRGNRAKEFRVANTLPKAERELRDAEQLRKTKKLTPAQAFTGGATGLAIAFVLWGFTQTVVGSFDGKPVPESYQARQITITVRTIITGLCYLATFVYAANGTGLVALAAQKWLVRISHLPHSAD